MGVEVVDVVAAGGQTLGIAIDVGTRETVAVFGLTVDGETLGYAQRLVYHIFHPVGRVENEVGDASLISEAVFLKLDGNVHGYGYMSFGVGGCKAAEAVGIAQSHEFDMGLDGALLHIIHHDAVGGGGEGFFEPHAGVGHHHGDVE